MEQGTREEDEDKQDMRIGGRAEESTFRSRGPSAWTPYGLGLVIASCDRGNIRHSAHGLYVYNDEGLLHPGGEHEQATPLGDPSEASYNG